MNFFKQVSFLMNNLGSDTIQAIGPLSVNNLTGYQLAEYSPGQFYIEKNTYGEDRLCSVCLDGQKMTITATNAQQQQYTVTAENFEIVNVIGGHPTHPISRPK